VVDRRPAVAGPPSWWRRRSLSARTVWDSVYIWILAFALVAIVGACADLVRPQRTGLHFTLRVIGGIGGLAVLFMLLSAGHFVVYADLAAPSQHLDKVLRAINLSVYWGLVWVALIVGATLLIEIRAWIRGQGSYRHPHPGAHDFAPGK
jgi:hypothetical protein